MRTPRPTRHPLPPDPAPADRGGHVRICPPPEPGRAVQARTTEDLERKLHRASPHLAGSIRAELDRRATASQDTPELGGMPAPAPAPPGNVAGPLNRILLDAARAEADAPPPAVFERWATEPADLKRYRVVTTHGSLNVHATCQADAIRRADESRHTEPGEMALGAYLRPDRRPPRTEPERCVRLVLDPDNPKTWVIPCGKTREEHANGPATHGFLSELDGWNATP